MTRAIRTTIGASLLVLSFPPFLSAQGSPRLDAGVTLAGVRTEAGGAPGVAPASGIVLGGNLGVRVGRFALRGSYVEGEIEEDDVAGARVDFVSGNLGAGVRLAPWLEVGGGVRVTSISQVDPERWVAWGVGVRADFPIIGQRLRGHAMFSKTVDLSVNIPARSTEGRTGEVGIEIDVPDTPLTFGLVTTMEQSAISGGRRRDLEFLSFTIGVRRP
jgi:hypothetical protein